MQPSQTLDDKSDTAWISRTGSLDFVGNKGTLSLKHKQLSFTQESDGAIVFDAPINEIWFKKIGGTSILHIHTQSKSYFITFFNPIYMHGNLAGNNVGSAAVDIAAEIKNHPTLNSWTKTLLASGAKQKKTHFIISTILGLLLAIIAIFVLTFA